jgi:hypothetical protein
LLHGGHLKNESGKVQGNRGREGRG